MKTPSVHSVCWKTICEVKVTALKRYSGTRKKTFCSFGSGCLVCFRRGITLGPQLCPVLATSARRCVPSCLLGIQGSSKDERQEVAEIVFPFAICFEPSQTYFFIISVQVSKGTTYNDGLCNWLLADSVAVATCQVHYRRGFGASALEGMSS